MTRTLRVMVLGSDPSLWVPLTRGLGDRPVHIFVTDDLGAFPASEVDAVVVDLSDRADAVAVLRSLARRDLPSKTVVITREDDAELARAALAVGVAAYLSGGLDHFGVVLAHVAAGGAHFDPVAAGIARRAPAGGHIGAAQALASALELKDSYTGGHAERVTALALRLALAAGVSPTDRNALEIAFLLHDVGKIGIPDAILTKPGPLTGAERRVVQTHPVLGEPIVAPLGLPDCVRQVVRHHHERWDGSGYPDGLTGTAIPLPARIFAIADTMDAMTSLRPYRRPVSFEHAAREVTLGAGSQFDPSLCALVDEVFLDRHLELLRNSALYGT